MTDETIEKLLVYCDDTAETTTSDAARLVWGIARLGKVYCDLDATLADCGNIDATRNSNLARLAQLATEMQALCCAHGEAVAENCQEARAIGLLAVGTGVVMETEEVLTEVRRKVGLPRLYGGLTWEELDESTKRQMRMDAQSDPNLDGEWDHGD